MAAPRTLILVRNEDVREALTRLVQTLPARGWRQLGFELVTGDVQGAVAEWREREPDAPIGFVAPDEHSALAALSGGADEALVVDVADAQSVSAFADRVELRARLRADTFRLQAAFAHAEKLTALGTLVAGVGHEINNPLSAVMLSIEAARRQVLPVTEAAAEIVRAADSGEPISPAMMAKLQSALSTKRGGRDSTGLLDDIGLAANAIASIVRDLRVFARTDDHELPEVLAVPELIDHVLRLFGRDVLKHGIIERDYAADLPRLVLPRNRVTQVVMNVLINATHAIADIERPAHKVRIGVRSDEDFVAIAVSDTGPGIPPESLERIFDPFFTTKRHEQGTGLGLSISRAIMRNLGGELTVESVYGEGATFICFLPRPTEEILHQAFRQSEVGAREMTSSRGTTVMIVDEDARMLRSYARLLDAEHRIIVAYGGREAIDMLESGSAPNLAIVELDLSGNDGPQLLAWLIENRPELARNTIIVTSADVDPRNGDLLRAWPCPILRKPVRGEALLHAIATLLDGN